MQNLAPTVRSMDKEIVKNVVDEYHNFHDDTKEDHHEERVSKYAQMVNHYYNLATDFYEWGWGQSFHFAIQYYGESFQAAIARHEHYLALRLGVQKGWKVLDVGCGVGGPARSIARLGECHVTGLNNNAYQIERGRKINQQHGMSDRITFVKGDFMHQPFEDNTFDAAYQIDATAHAPDKVACFKEIFRVLKPGQIFAGYEWCLTSEYDPENPLHQWVKKGIEEGTGLPDIASTDEVLEAMRAAGFEDVYGKDCALEAREGYEYPWYRYLTASYLSPTRFQFTPIGKWFMAKTLNLLETVRIVPKGTADVSAVLHLGGETLSKGGELGIFTPVFFHWGRKPLNAKDE